VVFIINAGATVTISEVTIEHGSSLLGGGIFNAGTLTLTDSVVTKNTLGTQLGGGIFNAGTLTLISSTVSGNSVVSGHQVFGAGIYNYLGTLTLTNSTVSGNTAASLDSYADSFGGGIDNYYGVVTLTNSAVTGNTAGGGGGGIDNEVGTLQLVNSTVSGNQASVDSGGIRSVTPGDGTATVSLLNSTVSGNSCGPTCQGGGGITVDTGKGNTTMTLGNSTVSGNSCTPGSLGYSSCAGGIYDSQGAPLIVKNSILANNGQGGNCNFSLGEPTSEGYNLSDDASCATFLTQTGDLNNTPAGLDPSGLGNNGGPTQTVALLATSAAVNAIPLSSCTDVSGNQVTTDQRGVPRPQGSACDIGAFEYFQSSFMLATVQTFDLEAQVRSLPLPKLPQQVLTVPLQATVASLNRGNVNAAVLELGTFIVLVDVERLTGGLGQAQAAALTTSARQIIQSLRN